MDDIRLIWRSHISLIAAQVFVHVPGHDVAEALHLVGRSHELLPIKLARRKGSPDIPHANFEPDPTISKLREPTCDDDISFDRTPVGEIRMSIINTWRLVDDIEVIKVIDELEPATALQSRSNEPGHLDG
jgi:hypothetical protein